MRARTRKKSVVVLLSLIIAKWPFFDASQLAYERAGDLVVDVYERVGKSVILVFKKAQKG